MAKGAIERRRLWLKAVFGSALAAASAPVWLVACSSPASEPDAGRRDASPSGTDAQEGTHDASVGDTSACVSRPDIDAAYYDEADAEICPVTLPCGLPPTYGLSGCEIVSIASGGIAIGCSLPLDSGCEAGGGGVALDASVTLECFCDIFSGGGRRPSGWRPRAPASTTSSVEGAVGRALARMAVEEAVSIDAFARLEAELRALGAPAELVEGAARARRDERRHTVLVQEQARRFGAEPCLPHPRRLPPRPLAAVARDNARHGCVRETYAALLSAWQAGHADDPALRRVMRRVARDELRHAALAWAVADWAEGRLGRRARKGVTEARADASRRLRRELGVAPDPAVARVAGAPSTHAARVLLASIAP